MPLDVGCLGGGGPTLAITQGYAGVRVRIPDAGRAGRSYRESAARQRLPSLSK